MTGFALEADSTGTYPGWTSTQVSGKCYGADNTASAMLTIAVSDVKAAYTSARGQTAGDRSNGALGTISGLTSTAGVYNWDVVSWTTDITITGSRTDEFVIQCNQVTAGSGTNVILEAGETGGGTPQACNIVWAVSGVVAAGVGAHLEGILLTSTMAAFQTGSSLNGRIMAQTACTLDQVTITEPPTYMPSSVPSPVPSSTPSRSRSPTTLPTATPTLLPSSTAPTVTKFPPLPPINVTLGFDGVATFTPVFDDATLPESYEVHLGAVPDEINSTLRHALFGDGTSGFKR